MSLIKTKDLKKVVDSLKVLDCSWYLPTSNTSGVKQFKKRRIPKAVHFDIDIIQDLESPYPHQLPSISHFEKEMSNLNIKNSDDLVLYDHQGMFCAPRTYYMLKHFGHQGEVVVLDGGLIGWSKEGELEKSEPKREKPKSQVYKVNKDKMNADIFIGYEEMLEFLKKPEKYVVIDARSNGRFTGEAPEPRESISSGHMPNAKNLPFDEVLEKGFFKSKNELKEMFDELIDGQEEVIFTCGSGLTASILAFAYDEILGMDNFVIYDGSWSEYATKNPDGIVKEI